MTISLVPNKEPGGPPTQQIEAQTAEVGLPQTVGQQAPQAPLRQATPRQQGEFDALESRTPEGFGQLRQNDDARILDEVELSQNPVLRDLASRLRT